MGYLTTKEVMTKLKLSRSGIFNLVSSGELPRPLLVGIKNLFDEDELTTALAAMKAKQGAGWTPTPPPASPQSARA